MQSRHPAKIGARRWTEFVAPAGALIAAGVALCALLLRLRDPLLLMQSDRAVMVPATAIGVLFAAGALLLLLRSRAGGPMRALAGVMAASALAVGALAFGLHLAHGSAAAMQPGVGWWAIRPSPLTALGLVFAGISLLALASRHAAARRMVGGAAAVVLVVALTGLIGHVYGEGALYRADPWSATALSTILALAALGLGALFAHPARGLAAIVGSDGSGGRLLRRLAPAAVFAPILLGWAVLALQQSWGLRHGFATALLVVSLIVLLVALLVRQAAVLHALDADRERLLAGERTARRQVTRVLESITDAFFTVDADWRFAYVNREAERILRRPRAELIGRRLWSEYPEAVDSVFEREYVQAVEKQRTAEFVAYYPPLGIWVDVRAYPSRDGLSVYFHDVTARKLAEEQLRESERNFRVLANSIPQLAWMADASGSIFWYSERWYEYTGTTFEQMRGWGWQAVHHPDHVQRVVERIRHAFETGEPWEDTFPLRSGSGEYRWFLSRAEPVRDAEGRVLRWFGTNTDVTDQRRAEEALRESEERYRLLADLIPQHIWTTDPDGYHTWFSRRWYEFAGTDHRASEGEGWMLRLHPDDRQRTLIRWQHSLRTGEPYAIEYRFCGVDGHYHWFLGQAMPLRDDAGRIVEWFGTLTDISERKRLEQERERLLEKAQDARAEAERRREALERVTESRASLMRGFGHDVKNPLGSAHLHAELLERGLLPGELSPRQRDSVHVIRRSIRNALQLIDDLLELAQAEAGQLDLACVPIDPGEIVRETAGDFRQQAMAAGLRLDLRVEEGLHALADPARLRQVLGNLLSNAAKYAPHGRLDVIAEHRASGGPRPGHWIAVGVTDSGPGIPPEKHESVFHEYVRLDPNAAQGAGIGLAISRTVARLMGGDLTVASEVGRGSTFTIWLPSAARPGETASAA